MENNKQQMNLSGKSKGWIFGFLLILVGVLFLAFNFGWLNPALQSVLFSWPMIFVLFAFIALSKKEYWGILFWLLLAAFFLLPRIALIYPDALPGIDGDFAKIYWPVLLIMVGAGVLLKVLFIKQPPNQISLEKDRHMKLNKIEGADGFYTRKVVFGGNEDIFLEPIFRGGRIEVVFGGVELDLRRTSLPEGDTFLYVEAVFGGIKLQLPNDWVVVPQVNTVLGGVENKRFGVVAHPDTSRRLLISGEMVFGGCEIR